MSLALRRDTVAAPDRVREPGAADVFVPLLRAALRHDYGDSALTGLRLVASAPTRALCQHYGLLLRSDAQGLTLVAPQRALAALWQAQRDEGLDYLLLWRLECSEALFALASADDAPRHLLLPLATCSALDTDCERWCASLGPMQELRFAARQCEWKYLLVGDWAGLVASGQITDLQIAATSAVGSSSLDLRFARDTEPETLPDGRQAWVYRSPEPLALAQYSPRRVALIDASHATPRVLMGALAHGGPKSLQRRAGTQGTHWVTEIFLIR
jgi:hypothetical protein